VTDHSPLDPPYSIHPYNDTVLPHSATPEELSDYSVPDLASDSNISYASDTDYSVQHQYLSHNTSTNIRNRNQDHYDRKYHHGHQPQLHRHDSCSPVHTNFNVKGCNTEFIQRNKLDYPADGTTPTNTFDTLDFTSNNDPHPREDSYSHTTHTEDPAHHNSSFDHEDNCTRHSVHSIVPHNDNYDEPNDCPDDYHYG